MWQGDSDHPSFRPPVRCCFRSSSPSVVVRVRLSSSVRPLFFVVAVVRRRCQSFVVVVARLRPSSGRRRRPSSVEAVVRMLWATHFNLYLVSLHGISRCLQIHIYIYFFLLYYIYTGLKHSSHCSLFSVGILKQNVVPDDVEPFRQYAHS